MSTPQDFILNGYQKYNKTINNADTLYQKRILNQETGKTLYFINVYEWSFPTHTGITAEVTFYDTEGKWFTATLQNAGEYLVSSIERFFANVYKRMNCVPNIYNND